MTEQEIRKKLENKRGHVVVLKLKSEKDPVRGKFFKIKNDFVVLGHIKGVFVKAPIGFDIFDIKKVKIEGQ